MNKGKKKVKREKPLKVDMSFEESMQRIVRVKKKDVDRNKNRKKLS